ncbi:unnamed protein product [Vitrella brassicaformis CCMP3155]|uniref:Uncharacterized protein n=1 Tax=Vitrella brassicaformis (strain CCMP3155) TaxID=1169540 RepID=A0A0G4H0D3_VITBC|nr:unnamed protein product [Vitrella brassicaformis CCMP3155]|eukprot:CEM36972.1 unnamed protein product [Vitrella brassicaformis CCMP3155]
MRFGFGIVLVVGLAAIVQPLLAAQRTHGQHVSTVELSMVQQQMQMGRAIYQSAMKLNTAANELTIAANELTDSAIQAINVAIDKAHSIAMMQMTAATESHQQQQVKPCLLSDNFSVRQSFCGTGDVCVIHTAENRGGTVRFYGVCASDDDLAAKCHKTTDQGERPKIAYSSEPDKVNPYVFLFISGSKFCWGKDFTSV